MGAGHQMAPVQAEETAEAVVAVAQQVATMLATSPARAMLATILAMMVPVQGAISMARHGPFLGNEVRCECIW